MELEVNRYWPLKYVQLFISIDAGISAQLSEDVPNKYGQ